jgi:hypothetical protein
MHPKKTAAGKAGTVVHGTFRSKRSRLASLDSIKFSEQRENPLSRFFAGQSGSEKTAQKSIEKSMACSCRAITFACYLCNTHPKTRCSRPFQGVPLLLVQGPSVS